MGIQQRDLEERGIGRSLEDMLGEARRMIAESVESIPVGRVSGDPRGEFTEGELGVLERGGIVPLERGAEGSGAAGQLAGTTVRYAALLAAALTEADAAGLLGVSQGRVRQRIAEGTLYAIRAGKERRLPRFQFDGDGEVPNVGEVMREVPADAHPVSVERWFTEPEPELSLSEGEEGASPRDWLISGGSPEAIKALAVEL